MLHEVRPGAGLPDLEPWTIHDLRRTVGTGLGKLGISRFIIARVLNHADRTVTAIYDRHEYLDEKRHAGQRSRFTHYYFAPGSCQ